MLEGYAIGQQRYSMHQENWENGYHHQGHLPAGMPVMPNYFMESPPPRHSSQSHQMMMFHGNHGIGMHQDSWHAQNMHQNAWQSENMRPQHCIPSPEKYGRFNGAYAINAYPMVSNGGKYPNLMTASSEYESFSSMQQVPATKTYEAMGYEQRNWGGQYRDGFNLPGNGCQSIDWVSKAL